MTTCDSQFHNLNIAEYKKKHGRKVEGKTITFLFVLHLQWSDFDGRA